MGARSRTGVGVVAAVAAVLLTGCVGLVSHGDTVPPDEHDHSDHAPAPSARTHDDAVEVWDLTGAPTAAKYGIPEDEDRSTHVGAYSSKLRQVRLLLGDGKQVTIRASDLVFEYWDADTTSTDPDSGAVIVPAGRHYQLQVSGWATEDPDEAVRHHRSVVQQLGLGDDSVTRLQDSITAAYDPLESGSAGGSDRLTTSAGTSVSVSTHFRPAVGVEYRSFLTDMHVYWDVQPLP